MKFSSTVLSACLLASFENVSSFSSVLQEKRYHTKQFDSTSVCSFESKLYMVTPSSSSSSSENAADVSNDSNDKVGAASDAFLTDFFTSECDDFNIPPSLSIIKKNMKQLLSGSDIRGTFVDYPRLGNLGTVAQAISKSTLPALTPFAAHCFGFAFATMLKDAYPTKDELVVCVGRDPRQHGTALADAFSRGAENVPGVRVVYTGIATTPSMFEFCRSSMCDGGVMVTASHLPDDRNGMKFFSLQGGFSKSQVQRLIDIAQNHAERWYDMGLLPPTSGHGAVFCSEHADWMPHYQSQLKQALLQQVQKDNDPVQSDQILKGLKVVLNSGNGSGGFFLDVLKDLGADVDGSINVAPDSSFPKGVPNPENQRMIEETIKACQSVNADIGILLDTDADRCGLVVPRTIEADGSRANYEPLNRNRLIALMGVIFSKASPGCAIVTDSVTSNGLAKFLEKDLGLVHVRYLKGYANVINKAKSLTSANVVNAEVAIETSGHCALKENDYLDDGTYTAVKIIGLLAQEKLNGSSESLLDLISNLEEMDEVAELRMELLDGSLESMHKLFDHAALVIEQECQTRESWVLDTENLEGVRVSTGDDGGFFMLRKSLHDPVISLQVEAASKEAGDALVVSPLMELFESMEQIKKALDLSNLQNY